MLGSSLAALDNQLPKKSYERNRRKARRGNRQSHSRLTLRTMGASPYRSFNKIGIGHTV